MFFIFFWKPCHRHCEIAEVKSGRAGLVLGCVTATGMLIGSFNTIGERKWLFIQADVRGGGIVA